MPVVLPLLQAISFLLFHLEKKAVLFMYIKICLQILIMNQAKNTDRFYNSKWLIHVALPIVDYLAFTWSSDVNRIGLIVEYLLDKLFGLSSLIIMFKLRKNPCALEESLWKEEAITFQCSSTVKVYHCIPDENNRLGEVCVQPVWVKPSKY